MAERAERFQVALYRHEIESTAELGGRRRRRVFSTQQLQEDVDQLVDALFRQIDVRIAQ